MKTITLREELGGDFSHETIEKWIKENVVADTEIEVDEYVHQPNHSIAPGLLRVILIKDGRLALLTKDVAFFLSPEDVNFIARLSQGQREKAA